MDGALVAPSSESASDSCIEFTAAMAFRRRNVEMKLVLPGAARQNDSSRCDATLIKAAARGRAWFEELASGRARSFRELAERDGITPRYVRRLVYLAFLSPDLVEAMLQGRQPVELLRGENFSLPSARSSTAPRPRGWRRKGDSNPWSPVRWLTVSRLPPVHLCDASIPSKGPSRCGHRIVPPPPEMQHVFQFRAGTAPEADVAISVGDASVVRLQSA